MIKEEKLYTQMKGKVPAKYSQVKIHGKAYIVTSYDVAENMKDCDVFGVERRYFAKFMKQKKDKSNEKN